MDKMDFDKPEKKVIDFTGATTADIPIENVLQWADHLEEAIIVGYDDMGDLYVAGTSPNVPDVVYLLEMAKKYMMEL